MQSYLIAMMRCFEFSGRSSRKEFWLFNLFYFLEMAIAFAIGVMTRNNALGLGLVQALAILHLIPMLSAQVRRLHDTDRSGWWFFIQLLPFGQLIALVLYCLPSTDGENRFGPDPREDEAGRSTAPQSRWEERLDRASSGRTQAAFGRRLERHY